MKKIIAIVLSLVLVFSLAACSKAATSTAAGTFSFTVVDLEGNEKNYQVPFDADETVGQALLDQKLIEGEDSEYGLFVKTVDGITLDYDKDGAFWSFKIGDTDAATGVDGEKAVDGGLYSLVATKG